MFDWLSSLVIMIRVNLIRLFKEDGFGSVPEQCPKLKLCIHITVWVVSSQLVVNSIHFTVSWTRGTTLHINAYVDIGYIWAMEFHMMSIIIN